MSAHLTSPTLAGKPDGFAQNASERISHAKGGSMNC
jgi:hypothetical protein